MNIKKLKKERKQLWFRWKVASPRPDIAVSMNQREKKITQIIYVCMERKVADRPKSNFLRVEQFFSFSAYELEERDPSTY